MNEQRDGTALVEADFRIGQAVSKLKLFLARRSILYRSVGFYFTLIR